jgi:hypothetical protein
MLNKKLELDYLREAVPLLASYLLSKEAAFLLPGLSGRPELPFSQLTIGPLLLMLKRLKSRSLEGSALEELGQFEEQIFQLKIHNEAAWRRKAGQDLSNRARLWGATLEDARKEPRVFASAYANAAAQRVMIHLLWEEMETGGIHVAKPGYGPEDYFR